MKRRFLFLLMAAFTFVGAQASINRANNYLYGSAATAKQGQTVEVTLNMKNAKDIINWQTELVLPEGITLVSAVAADRWTEAIQVNGNVLFSETETPVTAGEGVAAKITLQVASTVAAGEYEIALSKMVMTALDAGTPKDITQVENKVFKLTVEEATGLKGDVNGDGDVDVMDVVAIYNVMLGNAQYSTADVNGDGDVDVMDVVAVYNIMLGND